MPDPASRLFLPGFGARARAYAEGLPLGWEAFQPPPPSVTHGSLSSLRESVVREIEQQPGGALVAGHSMGAALAVLAAVTVPEQIDGLLLIAPAGLPLRKPLRRSVADLGRQLARRQYPLADVVAGARELVAAPLGTARLVRALRRLDLSTAMERVRDAGIRTLVVGCTTDTLVTPEQCRLAARLLGAEYRELAIGGGHVWPFQQPSLLGAVLRGEAGG